MKPSGYENIGIRGDVVIELRKVRHELTGKAGKRITLTETLQVLINHYREQDPFAFLDSRQDAHT